MGRLQGFDCMTTSTIRISKALVDKIPPAFKQQAFVDACLQFGLANQDKIIKILSEKKPQK